MNKNVFIIGPNNSGTTLLMEIMKTCPYVISHRWEGCAVAKEFMPFPPGKGLASIWTEMLDELRDEKNYNWPQIKKIWFNEWKKHPNYGKVKGDCFFLEKTPRDLVIVDMLRKQFKDPFFIITQRNPYALVEGILRRKKQTDVKRVAIHILKCMEIQIENIEKLGTEQVNVTYEKVCNDKTFLKKVLKKGKYPRLGVIDTDKEFTVHSYMGRHSTDYITNYNSVQLKNLSDKDVEIATKVFSENEDALKFFGYKLR